MKICILLPRFNKNPFIYDPHSHERIYNYMMPLGLAYISSVLKQNNFDVTVINLNHEDGLINDILNHKLTETIYDILFTGSLSIYYPNIRDYIKYIREISPNTKIVVGGGLISAQPEIMFKLLKPDFIVIGEGEQTVIELVKCIENNGNLSNIDGLGFYQNALVINKPRKPIMNLDTIPFPDHKDMGLNEYLNRMLPQNYILFDSFDNPRAYPILMSRSCPFGCTFCYHQIGKKYRQRSIENIMDEIRFVTNEYKINIFSCYDELFAYDKERIIEFCNQMRDFRETVPWDIKWNCSLRVSDVDDELIKIMKESGCFLISFGLESYSNVILESMRKKITSQQIDNALQIVSNNNIAIQGTFIFGDPAETIETAQETLNYFKEKRDVIRGGVQLGFIIVFQGSPLYNWCIQTSLITNEVEFIENRAKNGYVFHEPMNMTGLSNKEFYKLKSKIMTDIYTVGHHITPIKSDNIDGASEVHIKCPYCNNISILKNMPSPKGFQIQNIGCRYCNGRFDMVSKYYIIRKMLLKTVGFYNLLKVSKFFRN